MSAINFKDVASARKKHACSWCSEAIDKGAPYKSYRWVDGGDISTVKMHPECMVASGELALHEGDEIYFNPGDHPRGCYCEHDKDCKHCGAKTV